MADVVIHDLDPELLKRLERRAKVFGRSVEEELLVMIDEHTAKGTIEDLRRLSRQSHERFRGRMFSDSTDDIREDRDAVSE